MLSIQRISCILAVCLGAVVVMSCGGGSGGAADATDLAGLFASRLFAPNYDVIEYESVPRDTPVNRVPERVALYGDLHVHTALSFDGYSMGTMARPDDAYRYAKGEALRHPAGFDMQLERPLDFYAVTDHAMFLGLAAEADADGSEYSELGVSERFKGMNDLENRSNSLINAGRRILAFGSFLPETIEAIRSGELPEPIVQSVAAKAWIETIEAAREHYIPGQFTTFVAYEYTSTELDGGNLHRNVIFSDSAILPAEPFSTMHSENPEHLWDWMDVMRGKGIESLAIPHNPNGSNGHMFEMTTWDGSQITQPYVEKRLRNEPLVEITQIKGTSETHPVLSPSDEWADFEITGYRVASTAKSEPNGSYIRQAYQRGLELEQRGVGNPYDFGVIGSSDTHNAASGIDEEDFVSKVGLMSSDSKRRGAVPLGWLESVAIGFLGEEYSADIDGKTYISGSIPTFGASGLAGVWAESNTREDIYAAFRRKETFATSGPRISLRFFAGANFSENLLRARDPITLAYKQGVPMGGALVIEEAQLPRFFLWATADPLSAPLQRVQIVKVWLDDEKRHQESVYDVACAGGVSVNERTHRCPDNGALVDLGDCSFTAKTGASEIKTLWTDPDYHPAQRAVYYARVLENPTCRWSTWDALRAGVEPRADLQPIIQERAWSSAINISQR